MAVLGGRIITVTAQDQHLKMQLGLETIWRKMYGEGILKQKLI